MAVTYSSTVKDNRLTQVVNAIDGGVGAGLLRIYTSAYGTLLAELTLNDPCGTVSSGVLTFDNTPEPADSSANATGTAAIARITDSSGTMVVEGLTVGTSATDIIINSTSITSGQTVTMTSGTITHA